MSNINSENQNLLLFCLNSTQLFALNVLKIKEIITYKPLNKLPDTHSAIAGITELRGVSMPVIDLSMAIGQPSIAIDPESPPSIIIIEANNKIQGLLVQSVENIASIDWQKINAVPNAIGNKHYASGIIEINNKLVTLLDVEKIIDETSERIALPAAALLSDEKLEQIKGKSILVVDDSKIAMNSILSIVKKLGVHYKSATCGHEALSTLADSSTPFDMIISDIEMPEIDGYLLAKKIRELPNEHAKTYILLHTSLSINSNNESFKRCKANSLLTKFVPNALANEIYKGIQDNSLN